MTDLKPCVACGSENTKARLGGLSFVSPHPRPVAQCFDCHAYLEADTIEEAIALWNARWAELARLRGIEVAAKAMVEYMGEDDHTYTPMGEFGLDMCRDCLRLASDTHQSDCRIAAQSAALTPVEEKNDATR